MASDFFGRSYLVESENLVKRLIHILQSEVKIEILFYITQRRLTEQFYKYNFFFYYINRKEIQLYGEMPLVRYKNYLFVDVLKLL